MRNDYKKAFPLVKLGFIWKLLETNHEWILKLCLHPQYGLKDPAKASHNWFVVFTKKLAYMGEYQVNYVVELQNTNVFDVARAIPSSCVKNLNLKILLNSADMSYWCICFLCFQRKKNMYSVAKYLSLLSMFF